MRYWYEIITCAFIGHDYDDTPNYNMRETWRHAERRVQVWVCNRCGHWRTEGLEAVRERP